MQIASIPPPILTSVLPQDAANKAVPNVQAVAPLLPSAVNPAAKTEKFRQTRGNKDRSKDGGGYGDDRHQGETEEEGKEEHSVNISV